MKYEKIIERKNGVVFKLRIDSEGVHGFSKLETGKRFYRCFLTAFTKKEIAEANQEYDKLLRKAT